MSVLDAALELWDAGLAVIPVKADGTKAPAVEWKPYITTAPSRAQVEHWFTADGYAGVGVITGATSGGLEMVELEGRAAARLPQVNELADDSGLGDLWRRITAGWVELSPSGGWHFHYRVEGGPVAGNTKLAKAADRLVLAETRGEGGFVVVAPTPGSHHPTGKPWMRLIGDPTSCPTITADERDAVHLLFRDLDETPPPAEPTASNRSVPTRGEADGTSPGDDYEDRTDWTDILGPAGWTLVFTRGRTRYWRRPGKNIGISATTGHADDRDRLYVFTTSTDLEAERPYTKFGAYAALNHAGDHAAAAKQLVADGYGHRPEAPRTPADDLDGLIPPTDGANALQTAPAAAKPALSVVEPVTYSETDDGNALRLVDAHAAHVRYCPQRGSWLTWSGHRWTWDEAGHVYELARHVARSLPTNDAQAKRHRKVSLSARSINAIVQLASHDARTVVHLRDLDAHPYQLNTPAGVVDLRTATITTADPAGLHTRSTPIAPDLQGPPSRWLNFLADTFAGDEALTTYVQRLLGVSVIGTVLEQVLPFGFGSGANGKTTLVGVAQRVIGIGDDGYSLSAPAEMLLATQSQGHPTEMARLSGARFVVTSELEDGQRFAEARVKMLTGRDTIAGRFMRQDWFNFTPTHTLWLLANHQPVVRAGGPAFWRRLRLLPFQHTVPAEQRIADLEDQLVADEGPQILGWIIRGAADYLDHGLAEPDSVSVATQAYATDQDTVGRFVEEMCATGPATSQVMHVRVTALRAAYESWCREQGEQPIGPKALTQELRSRYDVQSDRDASARYYSGIRLETPVTDDTQPSQPGLDDQRWGVQ